LAVCQPLTRSLLRIAVALPLLLLAYPASALPRLLIDMGTGEVLQAEDAGQPWHPASLTKLMTAFVTLEAIRSGRLKLDTPVILSRRALREPPSKVGLPVDTAIKLEDALYLLIVKSANDIAIAIAETVSGSVEAFVGEMNASARGLGLSATHYANPHGLHNATQVTSARDLAVLALTIRQRYPEFAPLFATQSVVLDQTVHETHNNLLAEFSGTTGMKTGFICASGLNIVATVERGGRSLMAVVLGASSARERGEMTAQMVLEALDGRIRGAGQRLSSLSNLSGPPTDMRPRLCGENARAYVAEREAEFPFGLKSQPSFLSKPVAGMAHVASALGRLRDVPLPRPRPRWAPEPPTKLAETTAAQGRSVPPLPRPRPLQLRPGL